MKINKSKKNYNDPLIWTKRKTLSSKLCKDSIVKFENDDRKQPGLVGLTRELSDIKKSVDLNISPFDDWKDEDAEFFQSLTIHLNEYYDHCNQYNKYFPYAFEGLKNGVGIKDSGYQIQRTYPGEYYEWHHDGCVENGFVRVLTYLWYLNDVHEDGYTEFSNGMKIQPEEGKLLIFPATWTYIHRGYPPKSETKYICTGWISCDVRNNVC